MEMERTKLIMTTIGRSPKISNTAVGRGFIYGNGLHLVPRAIPSLERKEERFSKVVRTNYPGVKNIWLYNRHGYPN